MKNLLLLLLLCSGLLLWADDSSTAIVVGLTKPIQQAPISTVEIDHITIYPRQREVHVFLVGRTEPTVLWQGAAYEKIRPLISDLVSARTDQILSGVARPDIDSSLKVDQNAPTSPNPPKQ